MPGSISDLAASTADFPSTSSVFSIEPFLRFVQILKEQFLVSSRGHDFQGLTVDLMQHPAVGAVIEDKPVPLSDEFCQFCMALHLSHERANYLSKRGVESRRVEQTGLNSFFGGSLELGLDFDGIRSRIK
jgi:hypothetical protein